VWEDEFMPDIFNYTDYRKFLYDWFEEKKKGNPSVSFRMIAGKVGYKAPSYLPSLLACKVNMSLAMCLKFCSVMKLSKRACDYFQNMVLFCNAPSHEEKQIYFDKMRSFKEAAVRIVASDQYRFYEKWYHSAIRAVLDFFPFRDEYEMIGKLLIPEVSAEDVSASIQLLQELKMIEIDNDGCYRPVTDVISSGYDATGMAINTFLFNSLRLSESALGRFKMDERTFSCLTLGISEKGYKEIRQELRDFRSRVMKIATEDTADRIYQFGFQLFPLSHRYNHGEKK
jgi:uncharacterized protein (TIGR02147 family)